MKPAHFLTGLMLLLACACGESSPKVTQARVAVKELEKAVAQYRSTHGAFPEKLSTLTEQDAGASGPLLPVSGLTDPWGRPFHYDPGQLHPETDQPLIWSDGASPGEASSKIQNWVVKD
jgi:hypothetical protein